MIWKENPFFRTGVLTSNSTVLELGCGVSGVVALTVAPKVGRYIASDQEYVMRLLKENIQRNSGSPVECTRPSEDRSGRPQKSSRILSESKGVPKIEVLTLDWEQDEISSSLFSREQDASKSERLDAIIACDCIYNEALIAPFVETCVDACRLRASDHGRSPSVCIVAQQLRSPDVFEAWLSAFHQRFRVWRVPDSLLLMSLKNNSGYVVHVGVLRDAVLREGDDVF